MYSMPHTQLTVFANHLQCSRLVTAPLQSLPPLSCDILLLCMSVFLLFLYRHQSYWIRVHTNVLILTQLGSICKDPIFKSDHISRQQRLELQHIFLGNTSQPTTFYERCAPAKQMNESKTRKTKKIQGTRDPCGYKVPG